ncbi:hypothetical protein BCU86_17700 [Vibrio lentus]|nr:hypothetical protein BCU86_17700 [Vibrio lentus]
MGKAKHNHQKKTKLIKYLQTLAVFFKKTIPFVNIITEVYTVRTLLFLLSIQKKLMINKTVPIKSINTTGNINYV